MKEFDYYIFVDYSENLLGYMIVERTKIKDFVSKISKFGHYRELKNKGAYIHSIKKIIEKNNVLSYISKFKIKNVINTPEIYSDVLEFIKTHSNCIVFVSVDDKQYSNFERLVKIIDGKNIKIVQESCLKIGSIEYKMSLVIDTLLNIERLKNEKK